MITKNIDISIFIYYIILFTFISSGVFLCLSQDPYIYVYSMYNSSVYSDIENILYVKVYKEPIMLSNYVVSNSFDRTSNYFSSIINGRLSMPEIASELDFINTMLFSTSMAFKAGSTHFMY